MKEYNKSAIFVNTYVFWLNETENRVVPALRRRRSLDCTIFFGRIKATLAVKELTNQILCITVIRMITI